MERWMGSLPARWAVVVGAGLLALSLGLASYRIRAVEPEKTAAAEQPKRADKKKPESKRTKREALRYGGKNFDQWRVEMETELKPEIRADGMTAMAAFGANGYGVEATRTIVDLMAGYDLDTDNIKDKAVVEAAFEAVRKIANPALPVLWESVCGDNKRSRLFAIKYLSKLLRSLNTEWHPPVPELLKAAQHDDVNVRKTALMLLANIKNKPKSCLPVLLECLKDKESDVRSEAIYRLDEMRPEARELMPALSVTITDSEPWVRCRALVVAENYGGQAKPVVPALLKRLEKPDDLTQRSPGFLDDEFAAVMRTLAAIGPGAKEVLPRLRKLREKPPERSTPATYDGSPAKTYRELIDETIKKIEGK